MILPNLFRKLFFRKIIKMTTIDAIKSETVTLVDIRETYELEMDGAVQEAINIPMSEIPERWEEFKDMPRPVVIFCRGGSRAASVIGFLTENGIDDCFNGGGFADVDAILHS